MLKAEQFRQDTKKFWSKMDQIGKIVAADHVSPTSCRQHAVAAPRPPSRSRKKESIDPRGRCQEGWQCQSQSVPAKLRGRATATFSSAAVRQTPGRPRATIPLAALL